jgi:penicillin-binding protein 1B
LLYHALASSYNQATAKLGLEVGVKQVVKTLQAAGLERTLAPLPSVLLGALDLSPFQVSHLYHTLAADGVYTPLRAIRDVLDAQNKPLQRYPLRSEPRIAPELSYLMHYNLQAVMRIGTGKKAYQQLPNTLNVAGKTGTSNRQRDSWFAGYSADHLGVVWIGNDDNTPSAYTGSSGALPIWADIFKQLATRGVSHHQPDNVDYYWIDGRNGLLSAEGCQHALLIPFVAGTQPTEKAACKRVNAPVTQWIKRWFGH